MSFYLTAQHNLSVGMHSDSQNHYVFCQLKPITETHNLFFSFFFLCQVISLPLLVRNTALSFL